MREPAGAPDDARGLASLERALNAWLRDELGIREPRRVVRENARRIVVSKVAAGLAADLFDLIELTPRLFDESRVVAAYERCASRSDPAMPRTETWHGTQHELVREAGRAHGIPDERLAELRVGIDSVFAVLESVLWSRPRLGDAYAPRAGEIAAYRECACHLEPGRDLFHRYYGHFQGRAVENQCPGAALARQLLAHAWRACTGTPPPC